MNAIFGRVFEMRDHSVAHNVKLFGCFHLATSTTIMIVVFSHYIYCSFDKAVTICLPDNSTNISFFMTFRNSGLN